MKRPSALAFVLLLMTLMLSACGFHLRSALTLPPDLGPVRVVAGDPYSPLAESLAVALEHAGANLPTTPVGAGLGPVGPIFGDDDRPGLRAGA